MEEDGGRGQEEERRVLVEGHSVIVTNSRTGEDPAYSPNFADSVQVKLR